MDNSLLVITYATGTGGSFLQQYITYAKLKRMDPISLSDFGNAHNFPLIEIAQPMGGLWKTPDEEKIEFLLDQIPSIGAIKPYVALAHIVDLELAQKAFYKVIRITYDLDDIDELVPNYLGKFYLDQEQNKTVTPKDVNLRQLAFKLDHKLFTEAKNYPNVLYVTYKELAHIDSDVLNKKLSNFLNLDVDAFNVDNLIAWRRATRLGAELLKQHLAKNE